MSVEYLRPSVMSSFRGKQVVFSTWLASSPFVTSFVEDMNRGTAKETRLNTLVNREIRTGKKKSAKDQEESFSSVRDFTVASSDERKRERIVETQGLGISFSPKVEVYFVENAGTAVIEDVRGESRLPSMKARRMRASRTAAVHVNVRRPTTAAGKWIMKKSASLGQEAT